MQNLPNLQITFAVACYYTKKKIRIHDILKFSNFPNQEKNLYGRFQKLGSKPWVPIFAGISVVVYHHLINSIEF